MRKKIVQYNLLSYIFLATSVCLIIASFLFKQCSVYQYQIIFLAVVLYLASSLIHHYLDKSLTFEIGLEYILIGALAFLLVFGFAF